MFVTVLGSGTFQPTPARGCSSYLIQPFDDNILFDAGSGTLRQLAMLELTADKIDYLFLSHLHPDHVCDLVPILFAKRNLVQDESNKIKILGPPGFNQFFRNLTKAYGGWLENYNDFSVVSEYGDQTIKINGWKLNAIEVQHSGNCFGFRLEDDEGKIAAYSGDTEYCESLITLFGDSSIGILECSSLDNNKIKGHMSPSDIINLLAQIKCKRMLLTHIYPEIDSPELLDLFANVKDTEIEIASELKVIKV